MEALILLISAIVEIVVVVIPALVEAVALIAAGICELVLTLVLHLIGAAAKRRSSTADTGEPSPATQPAVRAPEKRVAARWLTGERIVRWRMWLRRLAIASGGLCVATLGAILIVNQFFFADVVRWGARDLPQRHGVTLDFAAAEGNLFTGHVRLKQAVVRRPQHASATFDFTIAFLNADIDVSQLLKRKLELEKVTASGIRGDYTRVGPRPEQPLKRSYVIHTLRIADAEINWQDATRPDRPFSMPVTVTHLEATGVRSDWAAFDVLFRSNGSGTLAGGPFTMDTKIFPPGYKTEWQAQGLPVTLANEYFGGPFRWITAGTVDARVVNTWQVPDEATDIRMQWDLTFRNVQAETPGDISPVLRPLAKPVVGYFNAHADAVPLKLETTISKQEFVGRMSPPLELITEAVSVAATKALKEKVGAAKERIKEEGRELLDKARDLLKRDEQAK